MKRVIFYFVVNSLLAILSVALEVPFLFALTIFTWLNLFLYSTQLIEKRYALLIFLVSYFIFLLGQEFCVYYLGFESEYNFSDAINQHTYLVLFLGLLGLSFGFIIFEKFDRNRINCIDELETEKEIHKKIIIKQIAKIGMLVTVLPYYYVGLNKGLFVLNNSYLEYYTSYTSNIPSIIENLSEMFTLFFFMFLATMPTKTEVRFPMLAYLGYALIFLMTGRRIQIGMTLMMIFAYYTMRHFNNKNEKWLKKVHMLMILIAFPAMIIVLYMFKYIRYGETIQGNGFVDMFFGFFYQQGTSINVIKFAKRFEGDSLGITSLYYTFKYFRTNIITGRFFQFPTSWYRLRNDYTAYYTNCLPDYIYYRISPYLFKKGYGLGASYLSELYHDGGYSLTVLGSMIYGVILQKLYSLKSNVWLRTIALLILEQLFILPRYGADSFLRPFYSVSNVLVFILCILLTNIIFTTNRKIYR
ncbi:TPA: O-antigen polysaccharide polymerase Wzy family protein [Streptococcus suis]|nr:O-antigen polysaccharide polymerase Wzy family protein [Streptococcus suis]